MREAIRREGREGETKEARRKEEREGQGSEEKEKKGRKSRCPDHILGSILSEFLKGRTTQASVFFKASQMILMCS